MVFEAEFVKGEIISNLETSNLEAYNLITESYLDKRLEIELRLIEQGVTDEEYKAIMLRELQDSGYDHTRSKSTFTYYTPKGQIFAKFLSSRDVGEVEEVYSYAVTKYKISITLFN